MRVYVRAKSKAELNRRLRAEETIEVLEYGLLRHGVGFTLGVDVHDGAEVAIFSKIQNGFPYAHTMATYIKNKNKVQ